MNFFVLSADFLKFLLFTINILGILFYKLVFLAIFTLFKMFHIFIFFELIYKDVFWLSGMGFVHSKQAVIGCNY
jgi:hypothetical protein